MARGAAAAVSALKHRDDEQTEGANQRALSGATGPPAAAPAAAPAVAQQAELEKRPFGLEFMPLQSTVRKFYSHNYVQGAVASVIIGNFIVTILEKEIDPYSADLQVYRVEWQALDDIFNSIFLIELLINMYGSWLCGFWKNGWNLFDTLVVIVGVLTMTRAELGPFSDLKMLRAFRVFRLFKRIPALNKIITALLRAIPGVINAFVIMLIIMCIYSILAVEYFRDFGKTGTFVTTEQTGVGEAAIFTNHEVTAITMRGMSYGEEYYGTFSRALYTLFQVLTGESWAEMVARPLLFGRPEENSSWSVFAVAFYFTSFILLHQIVLVNVVVAVLLDKFVEPEDKQEDKSEAEEITAVLDLNSSCHSGAAATSPPSATAAAAATAAATASAAAAAATPSKYPQPVSDDAATLQAEVQLLRAEVALQVEGMNEVKSQMERVLKLLAEQQGRPAAGLTGKASRGGHGSLSS